MEEDVQDAFLERIYHLEKALTRLRYGLLLLGLTTAAVIGFIAVLLTFRPSLLTTASAIQGRISAREFVVTDENGRTVGWFGNLRNGASGLIFAVNGVSPKDWKPPSYLNDLLERVEHAGGSIMLAGSDSSELSLSDHPDEKDRSEAISLSVNAASPGVHEAALRLNGRDGMSMFSGIESYDAKSKENASISLFAPEVDSVPRRETNLELDPDGSSYLQFGNGVLDPRARLETDAGGLPGLKFFDASGEQRTEFILTEKGEPLLALWGKGAKTYDGLYLRDRGVALADTQGKVRATLDDDGFTLLDEKEKLRAVLGSTTLETVRTGATETTAPSSLTLFDKDGKVIWQVPR
jgi:hypothetical protein